MQPVPVPHSPAIAPMATAEMAQLMFFFNESPNLMAAIDFNAKFKLINPAWQRVLGFLPADLINQDFSMILPPDEQSLFNTLVQTQTHKTHFNWECQVLNKNGGEIRWMEWFFDVYQEHQLIYISGKEITEKKSSEKLIKRHNQLINTIHQAQNQFITSVDSHILFDDMLKNILLITESEFGFIGEIHLNEVGKKFIRTRAITNIAWNEETLDLFTKNHLTGLEFHNLNNLMGAVVRTGKPVLTNDAHNDPRSGGLPHGHPTIETFLGLPLYHGRRLLGMVALANNTHSGYQRELVDYLQPVMSTCAHIIDAQNLKKQRLESQLELRAKEFRLRGIIDNIPDGIITFNKAGKIEIFNTAAENLSGYFAEEAKKLPVFQMIPLLEKIYTDNTLANQLEEKGLKTIVKHKNGPELAVYVLVKKWFVDRHINYTCVIKEEKKPIPPSGNP